MTRALPAAWVGLLLTLAATGQADADTRTLQGGALVLSDTLSTSITIDTDRELHGAVRLSADGGLGCVQTGSGGAVQISTGGCGDELGSLRITVPPSMAVTLTGSGDGSARIGDLSGALTATLNGSYDIKAGHVGRLVLTSDSNGDSVIGRVDGPAAIVGNASGDIRIGFIGGSTSISHHGSGDLAVGGMEASRLSIDSAGSGDILVGGGHIGTLQAHIVGSGDLAVAATVDGGDVAAVGGADVKLTHVTGELRRSAGGGSDISVGGTALTADVMSRVARLEAQLPGDADRRAIVLTRSNWIPHVLTVLVVGFLAFLIWRVARRAGVWRGAARGGAAAGSQTPLHPGVQSVRDTLARLDARLGRMEGYVTTREFDLNRKFRELG